MLEHNTDPDSYDSAIIIGQWPTERIQAFVERLQGLLYHRNNPPKIEDYGNFLPLRLVEKEEGT